MVKGVDLSMKRKEVLNWILENLSGSYSKDNEKILKDALEVIENETRKYYLNKIKDKVDAKEYKFKDGRNLPHIMRKYIKELKSEIDKFMGDKLKS